VRRGGVTPVARLLVEQLRAPGPGA
jgi:hypothetical protein